MHPTHFDRKRIVPFICVVGRQPGVVRPNGSLFVYRVFSKMCQSRKGGSGTINERDTPNRSSMEKLQKCKFFARKPFWNRSLFSSYKTTVAESFKLIKVGYVYLIGQALFIVRCGFFYKN